MNSLEKFIGSPLKWIKSLAWFGLAADPPTLAHRAVVDAVMGSGLVDKVIVFAAGKLPYKDFEATEWQRSEMLEIWKAAAEFGEDVVLSRFDMLRDRAFIWYDLWKKINQLSPKIKHYLVVGSDQYLEIPKSWHKGEELLEMANIIVVPREGYELEELAYHHILLDVEPIPGSGTDIRSGDLSLLDEKVKAYILEEKLYNSKK